MRLELEHEEILIQEQANDQRRALALKELEDEHIRIEDELLRKTRVCEERIQMAESDKEATLQSLRDAQAFNLKEMQNYFEDKVKISVYSCRCPVVSFQMPIVVGDTCGNWSVALEVELFSWWMWKLRGP